jgi:hypothetical protein
MKKLIRRIKIPTFYRFLFFPFLLLSSPAFSFTPMEYYNSLVAGVGVGFKDGNFNKALFNHPAGIAFNEAGSQLFVADQYNGRIRVIDLDNQNKVETLAGDGSGLCKDGPLTTCSFGQPWDIAVLPQNCLAVYDNGNSSIREINLSTKLVTTLIQAGNGGVWNLTYRPQDNSIYYSLPGLGQVARFDLKLQKSSVVFQQNPLIPHPKILKMLNGNLYVAGDNKLCLVQIDDKNPTSIATVALIADAVDIEALTFTDGALYALERGNTPLVEVSPQNIPVSFTTNWGFFAPFGLDTAEDLINCWEDRCYGLATSPREPRKFYVSGAGSGIYSFKDYSFSSTTASDNGGDYAYPSLKPPKTYRILMVGDSRLVTDPVIVHGKGESVYNRINTFSKQMEFMLNVDASRHNLDIHYEVLMLGHINSNALLFGYYEIPDLIKKYDVDTVCVMTSLNYTPFFGKPITPDGIPAKDLDPEFVLKPLNQRLPSGTPGQFYKDCDRKGYFKRTQINDYSLLANVNDPDLRNDLMNMLGRGLELILKKSSSIQLTNGKTPKLVLLHIPWDQLPLNDEDYEGFWKEFGEKYHVPLVSISEGFNTLREAYSPTEQECCAHHYNAYGHLLIAYLLENALIDQKLIPFEPENDKK